MERGNNNNKMNNNNNRGAKRSLEGNGDDGGDQPERKRPALARYVLLSFSLLFFTYPNYLFYPHH